MNSRDHTANGLSKNEPWISAPETSASNIRWRTKIAAVLQRHRHAASLALMESVAGWEKYAPDIMAARGRGSGGLEAYVRDEFYAFIDYLILFFQTGDDAYRQLYIGEKIKQAYYPQDPSAEGQLRQRNEIAGKDAKGLLTLLDGKLTPSECDHFQAELNAIRRILTMQPRHSLQVLLIGDCLFLDVMAFLHGLCLEDDVAVLPTFLASKNPPELRNELRKVANRSFDLVFFSPFTYEFSPEYAQALSWRQAALRTSRWQDIVARTMGEVKLTLDLVTDLFEANVFIHNSSNVRRHDNSVAERFKNLLTGRSRRIARTLANAQLAEYVAQRNAATYEHLHIYDEAALLQRHGDQELGQKIYDSALQHPAMMGKWVAQEYREIVAVHSHLLKRKVVVCDLDNTLWKGVIGEGAVEHYCDRQGILKQLQARGVLLAINSKNDPANVSWERGVLCADDFVCSQINWDMKVANMKRIGQHLNLKTKDFVFLDDRPDERSMVQLAMPEVKTLDATSDRTWRLLALWSRYLVASGESDRTQLYKQRESRETFLRQTAEEDLSQLFQNLGIKVTIRAAKRADLKRVAELINRTNQFNTCGSRTTMQEVTDWQNSAERRILVVDAEDRFGMMGTVSIVVIHFRPEQIEIPVFVLSCRVFGYGIEKVILNAVKRLARSRKQPVMGLLRETSHNEPCRKVYLDNGFCWNGSAWLERGTSEIQDPSWLALQFEDQLLVR